MELEENIEQQVITAYFATIVTSTQSCVETITTKCRSKNLIVQEVVDKILYVEATPGTKTRILLRAVQDCMSHNHTCFEEFLEILESELIFNDLIEQLRSARQDTIVQFNTQDQLVPDEDEDLFGRPTPQTEGYEVRRRKCGDSGFQSVSDTSDVPDPNDSQFVPPSMMAQMSRDSGISRGSIEDRTEELEPVQESPEGQESSALVSGRAPQQEASGTMTRPPGKGSIRIRSIKRMMSILRNLLMETQQGEAVAEQLKDEVDSLSKQLSDTVEEKKHTEKTLEEKTNVIKNLEAKQKVLNESLATKESELERLKSKLSSAEADRDKLKQECLQYEQDIESLTLEEKKQAEKTLEEKTPVSVIKYFEEQRDELKQSLSTKENELKELKLKLSSAESDRDKLSKECTQYEQEIVSLKADLASVSTVRDTQLKELEETKEILKKQGKTIIKLRHDILATERENSKLTFQVANESTERQSMEKVTLCILFLLVFCVVIIFILCLVLYNYYYNMFNSTDTPAPTEFKCPTEYNPS